MGEAALHVVKAETADDDSELVAFLRSMPLVYALKDANGRLRYRSERARQLFGEGDTHAEIYSPELAAEFDAADNRVLATGELVQLPVWLPKLSGGRLHMAVLKFPVRVNGEPLVGTIGLDITPFSSNAWDASTYRQILDAISDMILVKGPKSKLLWANKTMQTNYGMSNAELQGIIEAPFVEPDLTDKYAQDDAKVFATGKTLDIPEESMKWADGSTRTVHTLKSPIFDDDGKVKMMVAVIRDITDRKRLELELRQAQKLESLGRLAAGMAHEINTPIQFVGDQRQFAEQGVADLLGLISKYQAVMAKVAAGSATVTDALAIRDAEEKVDLAYLREAMTSSFADMGDGIRRVAQLVQALKEFGHPDQGDMEPADLNAAIRRTTVVTTNEYRYVADLVLDLDELPPIACNISEVQQVVLNLIVNAAHAIADKGSLRGTITVSTRIEDGMIALRVADTGCGIPVAIQSRIFDPFFTTKSVGRGTGQGLAIARMLAEKHKGSLEFTTSTMAGTTFCLKFPI